MGAGGHPRVGSRANVVSPSLGLVCLYVGKGSGTPHMWLSLVSVIPKPCTPCKELFWALSCVLPRASQLKLCVGGSTILTFPIMIPTTLQKGSSHPRSVPSRTGIIIPGM